MNLRQKPLVIALSLLLTAPATLSARTTATPVQLRDAAAPTVDEIAAATSPQLLVLQAGIFDRVLPRFHGRFEKG